MQKQFFTGSEIANYSTEYFNPIEYFFFCRELREHILHGHDNYLSIILTSILDRKMIIIKLKIFIEQLIAVCHVNHVTKFFTLLRIWPVSLII